MSGEFPVADVTTEKLVRIVDTFVKVQVTERGERLATGVALVGSDSRVNDEVLAEARFIGKPAQSGVGKLRKF